MSPHTQNIRKQLGAYYTPIDLSQVLSDWAIRSTTDKVLEPSFGGCGFLEACVESFKKVGNDTPENYLYGADIDVRAFDFLSDKLGSLIDVQRGNFKRKDFLKIKPKSFGKELFEVIIGNPPYVSLHNMDEKQRKSCFDILEGSSFAGKTIGRNASLWAYFLIHTMDFIAEDGRVAWVLPSSLLHANYAQAVLDMHKKHFREIKVIKLYERFFQESGADEVSVILIADGFTRKERSTPTPISYNVSEDIVGLEQAMYSQGTVIDNDNYKYHLLGDEVLQQYEHLSDSKICSSFGDVAKVLIGMVTGDNKTFIVNQQTKDKLNLEDKDLKPVISKFSQLTGFTHDMRKHKKLTEKNQRCLLVNPTNLDERHTPVRSYLATVPKLARKTNKTFPKRPNWFSPDDKLYPDAFLSYMIHKGPRLVINSAGVNCTNSIHRVFFTEKLSFKQKRAIAISLYSSFSQLSAELEGRSYGSGVLKLEPTPAKKIQFLLSDGIVEALNNNFSHINNLLLKNESSKAKVLIDSIICKSENLDINVFQSMSLAINQLRKERYQGLTRKNYET